MANIVITGANQGIGYFFVKKALSDGHTVTVLDIETDNLEKLKADHAGLSYYAVDVRSSEQMSAAISDSASKSRRIDIAIHNACYCPFEREKLTELETYGEVFDVNYYGALRLVKCVVPYMQAQKSGKIIFTSSGVGVTGFVGVSPYASSKGALESLAKCLGLEYAQDGISFHIIHPPLTRTKSSSPLPVPDEFKVDPQAVGYGLAKRVFSKRFIICHSVGQKVQTLCCYLFPVKMGRLLSKMTMNCAEKSGTPE